MNNINTKNKRSRIYRGYGGGFEEDSKYIHLPFNKDLAIKINHWLDKSGNSYNSDYEILYNYLKILSFKYTDKNKQRIISKKHYEDSVGSIIDKNLLFVLTHDNCLLDTGGCLFEYIDVLTEMSRFEACLNVSLHAGCGYFLKENDEMGKGFYDIYIRNVDKEEWVIYTDVYKTDVTDFVIEYAETNFRKFSFKDSYVPLKISP